MAELGITKIVDKIVDEIEIKVLEKEEAFIFETVKPYCEYITRMEITKKDLEEALLLRQNYEARLKTDMATMLEEIKMIVKTYEFKYTKPSVEHYFERIWKGKFIEIIQEKIDGLKENKDEHVD